MRDFLTFLQEFTDLPKPDGDLLVGPRGSRLSERTSNFIISEVQSILLSEDYDIDSSEDVDMRNRQYYGIKDVVYYCWPNVDHQNKKLLRLWNSPSALAKGTTGRTPMKMGRAIRTMFPCLTDNEVDNIVDKHRRLYGHRNFDLREATTGVGIGEVYGMPYAETRNIDTTHNHKALCNSCMRYDFSLPEHGNLPVHPATMYGEDEWVLVYLLEEGTGLLGGRVLLWKNPNGSTTAGPIYGVCTASIDMLQEYLDDQGIPFADYGDWVGATLTYIPHTIGGSNYAIGAYLDVEPRRCSIDYDDKTLTISRDYGLDMSNYSGRIPVRTMKQCDCCGEYTDPEELYEVEGDQEYCYECRDYNTFQCEACHCYHLNENVVEAYHYGRSGYNPAHIYEQSICDYCSENEYVELECDDMGTILFRSSDTYRTIDGNYIPVHYAEHQDSEGVPWVRCHHYNLYMHPSDGFRATGEYLHQTRWYSYKALSLFNKLHLTSTTNEERERGNQEQDQTTTTANL